MKKLEMDFFSFFYLKPFSVDIYKPPKGNGVNSVNSRLVVGVYVCMYVCMGYLVNFYICSLFLLLINSIFGWFVTTITLLLAGLPLGCLQD